MNTDLDKSFLRVFEEVTKSSQVFFYLVLYSLTQILLLSENFFEEFIICRKVCCPLFGTYVLVTPYFLHIKESFHKHSLASIQDTFVPRYSYCLQTT